MTQSAARDDQRAYALVGFTLLTGLWVSILVMAAGLALAALRGAHESGHVLPLGDILPGLAAGKPASILDTGILLLFATPFVGVLVALVEFARIRDIPFLWVTVALLLILAAGFGIALW